MIRRFLRWLLGPVPQFNVWALPTWPYADWICYRVVSRDHAKQLVSEARQAGWHAYYERVWYR